MDNYTNSTDFNSDGFDNCGYDCGLESAVDTRNTKYQAKINHISVAASNKSFNYKSQLKYMKRRDEKIEREQAKEQQEAMMHQMKIENQKWKAVDDVDARHMQKESEKRKKDSEKAAKKREKEELLQQEEEKFSKKNNDKKNGKKK